MSAEKSWDLLNDRFFNEANKKGQIMFGYVYLTDRQWDRISKECPTLAERYELNANIDNRDIDICLSGIRLTRTDIKSVYLMHYDTAFDARNVMRKRLGMREVLKGIKEA